MPTIAIFIFLIVTYLLSCGLTLFPLPSQGEVSIGKTGVKSKVGVFNLRKLFAICKDMIALEAFPHRLRQSGDRSQDPLLRSTRDRFKGFLLKRTRKERVS